MTDEGAILLVGYTSGEWGSENAGNDDFAAVKLYTDGMEEWRWQVIGARSSRG